MANEDMVPRCFTIGDLTFKAYDYRVFRAGNEKEVILKQPKEHQLLSYFALRWHLGDKTAVTRDELMDHMYPAGAAWNIVYVFMNKVRKHLEQSESTVTIRTVHGAGYLLEVLPPAAGKNNTPDEPGYSKAAANF